MMGRITIEQIIEGNAANIISTFQIKQKEKKEYKSSTKAIELLLSDNSGVLPSRKFISPGESIDKIFQDIKKGDIYEIAGSYNSKYNSLTISSLKKIEEFNLEDYITIPTIDDELLMEEIKSVIEELEDQDLKNLCEFVFQDDDFTKKFRLCPSAIKHHHAYIKGNLEHIVSVIKICKNLFDFYNHSHNISQNPYINKDLILTGAIFHDVGKIFSYKEHNGIVSNTEEGAKISHVILSNNFLLKILDNFKDFPEKLKTDLLHLILSHHGKIEWGSPITPQTPEAEILHLADLIDSRFKKSLEGKYSIESF